jgi:hypothetical protein
MLISLRFYWRHVARLLGFRPRRRIEVVIALPPLAQ